MVRTVGDKMRDEDIQVVKYKVCIIVRCKQKVKKDGNKVYRIQEVQVEQRLAF